MIFHVLRNSALLVGGGGIYVRDSCNVGIFNSIVWGNHFAPMPVASQIFVHTRDCSLEVVQCIIDPSGCNSSGALEFDGDIITSDPLFADSLGSLQPHSPAVDAGSIDAWSPFGNVFVAPWEDINGDPRPLGFGWDIGAHESPWDAVSESPNLPEAIGIMAIAPNPFNSTVTITIDIASNTDNAHIAIYDVMGKKIETLLDGQMDAGKHNLRWSPADNIASGVYFVRCNLHEDSHSATILYIR